MSIYFLQLSMFVDYTWQCMKLPAVETSLQGRTSPDSTTTPGEDYIATILRHTPSSRGYISLIGALGEENMVLIEGTEHTLHRHGNGEDRVTSTSDTPVCDSDWPTY